VVVALAGACLLPVETHLVFRAGQELVVRGKLLHGQGMRVLLERHLRFIKGRLLGVNSTYRDWAKFLYICFPNFLGTLA
jgi:hypothetical protein